MDETQSPRTGASTQNSQSRHNSGSSLRKGGQLAKRFRTVHGTKDKKIQVKKSSLAYMALLFAGSAFIRRKEEMTTDVSTPDELCALAYYSGLVDMAALCERVGDGANLKDEIDRVNAKLDEMRSGTLGQDTDTSDQNSGASPRL